MTEETRTYAKDIERIEEIVTILEQKDCDIDKMLDFVTEASELIQRCHQKLSRTGIQIDEALKRLQDMSGLG